MKRALALSLVGFAALLVAERAEAQTFPVVVGTLEFQGGFTAITVPEASNALIGTQPEVRVGYFIREGVQLQAMLDTRVWPLGDVGATSHGITANLLWFPNLGPRSRNLYLLVGAGGAIVDPPGALDSSGFDALVRGGVGAKVSLEDLTISWLTPLHLTVEFRTEYLLADESDIVSGVALGFSWFR